MSQEPIDYEAVIADLERQKAAIDTAIGALRQAMSLIGGQVSTLGAGPGRPIDPGDIPSDAFFGLSIGEAAKKYLTIVKRRQTIQEIADALERGGLPHTSTNFVGTVRAMINRLAKSDSELVRVGPGASWGLSGWYGNRRPKDVPPKGRARAKRGRKQIRPKERQVYSEPAAKPEAKSNEQSGLTLVQQAEQILRQTGALPIDGLIEQIEQRFKRKVTKPTLVGILAEKVRKQQIFARPAPNTYGLILATLH